MLNTKNYLKILFLLVGIIFTIVNGYLYNFSKNYPLPLTYHLSLDAKIKFIREHINTEKVDTIIVGSSLGLNNVDGVALEKSSSIINNVLNLSAYGLSAPEARSLLELSDAFPSLERMIFSAQYTDFSHKREFESFDTNFFIEYIKNDTSVLTNWLTVLKACSNIIFCIERGNVWDEEHTQDNKYSYLGFDRTGSVPLAIYGEDISPSRWETAQPAMMQEDAYGATYWMSKRALDKGIKFYFIQQVYREAIVVRDVRVREALPVFASRIRKIMKENNGKFMSLHETLHLGDEYFADRTHLNDKGSIVVAKAIGKFINQEEKEEK